MNRLTIRRFLTLSATGLAVPVALLVAACGSSADTSSSGGSAGQGTGGASNGTTGTGGATTGGNTTGTGGATTGGGTGGSTTGAGGSTGGTTGTGGTTTGGTTTGTGGATTGTGGATTGAGGTTTGTGGATTGTGGATTGTGGATGGAGGSTGGTGGTAGTGGAGGSGGSGGLPPPATGTGIQIVTKSFTVMPGQEVFKCYHTQIPLDTELDISEFESVMSAGSHHFILYRADGDTTAVDTITDGSCAGNFSNAWVYSSGQPHYGFKNPDGVAMVIAAKGRVMFDMHYLNTTTAPIDAKVALNMTFATGNFQKAAPLISFNTAINIPANGTQTVGGDCTPGAGANFYLASTHTHKRGTLATINRVLADGTMGEELVHTTDWEKPDLKSYSAAPFLTFKTGEKFHYSCTYQNDLNVPVTVGNSAATNEMCMAVTYFFPASAAGSCK